jgi:transcriptional regulator
MAPRDTLQGALDLMILKILSRQEPLHGYAIMSAIHQIGGEALRVEEGSLYPALRRMEDAGWLRAEWVSRSGRRARVYELTRAGRKQLVAAQSQWRAATAAVNRVLKMA